MKIEKPKQFCMRVKWRVIPFFIFFFIIVAVLLGVYRFRDTNNSSSHADISSRRLTKTGNPKRGSSKTSKTGWEDGRTNDRWIVISDDRQDFLKGIHSEYLCSLLEISADLEWRALVVGSNITCCRKSCVQLDDAKFKTLNYEIMNSIPPSNPEGRRNVGYLFAIKHGARHIFDAYLDTYVSANIDVETFKREISRQLQNMALNVALGLVSERPYVKRVQNPYAHFGRPDLWTEGFRRNNQRYVHNHIYRICEVRPPSIEKFLDVDENFFDLAAPSLTLPGSSIAPFSSKNTLYSIEAFWGLILLPVANATQHTAIPPHLLRTLWNQAVLGDIAGSIRLSLNNVTTLQRKEKNRKDPSELREPDGLASFLLKWTCSTRSSLSCIRDLFQNMFQFHYISEQSLTLFESWIIDLKRTHYLEPPVIPRRRGSMNPCLGADGLYGVAFYPSLAPKSLTAEQVKRRNATLDRYLKEEMLLDSLNRLAYEESLRKSDPEKLLKEGIASSESNGDSAASYSVKTDNADSFIVAGSSGDELAHEHRHGKSFDGHGIDEMPLLREFTESTCPGYSQLLPHVTDRPLKNLLLIVAMNSLRYDMIPMFEVIYREQFQNVLYCGSPHDSIEIFLRKYQLSEDRSFSFLPVHSKYTYECLLGALEMGYNVDGWIMTSDDALINSWNVPAMNNSKLWYSGDYSIQVNNTNWKSLDPGSQKLPRSLDGVQKVLEFLKSSLIGSTLTIEDHDQSENQRTKREAEITKLPTSGFSFSASPFSLPVKAGLDDIPILNDQDKLTNSEAIQKPKFSEKTLDLHSYGGGQIFDLVELKSIVTESTHPQTDPLPSLKYEIDADIINSTLSESNDSEPHHQEPILYAEEPLLDKNISVINIESAQNLSDVIEPAEDGQEGEELYEIEEEDEERPVAEVLRKLLVATRNTTTDSDKVDDILLESTGDQITSTVPNQVGSEVELGGLDNEPVEEMPIVLNADAIFDLEEDDWSKPNTTTRENPIIDLFLNPTVSTVLEGREEENQSSIFQSVNSSEFNLNQTEDILIQTQRFPDISLNATVESSDKNNTSDVTESLNEQLKPENVTEDKTLLHAGEDERKSTDAHVAETLENLQEIYNAIFENLGVPIEQPDSSHYSATAFYGGDRTPYRLNPKSINQFHCERGTNLEFCKVSSEFLYQLLENGGKELKLVYDKVPTYFIPKKDQLKFYLLSNLMLQHGVTDEIAIPLILTGLSPLQDWLKLDKTYFGGLKESASDAIPSKYPLFNPEAAILYPADLVQMSTDPKMQKVFCLKYLLRLLKS